MEGEKGKREEMATVKRFEGLECWKEAAETQYWLQLFEDADIGDSEERDWLFKECEELLAIFTSTGKTAKLHRQ